MSVFRVLCFIAFLPACATGETGAQKMGADAHEAAAKKAEKSSERQAAQYDPDADEALLHCQTAKGSRICWSSLANPTDVHLRQAETLRQVAATHRAASESLRAAEEAACSGIAEQDRDISPFSYTDDITAVEPLTRQGKAGKPDTVLGATVTLRAVPGLTAEWLQRVVDCHIARNASLGNPLIDAPTCPLVPKDVKATVTSTGTGFAVELRSPNKKSAEEILSRSQQLFATTALP